MNGARGREWARPAFSPRRGRSWAEETGRRRGPEGVWCCFADGDFRPPRASGSQERDVRCGSTAAAMGRAALCCLGRVHGHGPVPRPVRAASPGVGGSCWSSKRLTRNTCPSTSTMCGATGRRIGLAVIRSPWTSSRQVREQGSMAKPREYVHQTSLIQAGMESTRARESRNDRGRGGRDVSRLEARRRLPDGSRIMRASKDRCTGTGSRGRRGRRSHDARLTAGTG